ncbi:hypothetical protein ACFFOS_07825 [Nocardioides kongjuensis]|uniref:Uncharacterized protein n=1 Tax=Nocardioides kongjuensis TaxID=349522 RepID=A0A852RV50_9ACTN|nr:hypothetical protein [Nocardioides kongjuensis]NYD33076.1 hypothetical protein [Nocardioides kongjuensis]
MSTQAAAVPCTFDQARSIVEQLESAVVDVEGLTAPGPDTATATRFAEPPD